MTLLELFGLGGGFEASGPIYTNSVRVGRASRHGRQTKFYDKDDRQLGYAEKSSAGDVILRTPDGRTASRLR